MSLTKQIVQKVMKAPQIGGFRRYLFIGPHPDDIEIGAGATAAALTKAGKEVCFLICTDGRYGTDNCRELTGDDLAAKRKEEAIASAALLGVRDVRFGELSDGGFAAHAVMQHNSIMNVDRITFFILTSYIPIDNGFKILFELEIICA